MITPWLYVTFVLLVIWKIGDKYVNKRVQSFIHQTICVSKRACSKEKLLARNNKDFFL